MFSCAEFLERFSEFRDGYMSPEDRTVVEDHLTGCERCSRYLRVYDAGLTHLRALPAVEVSDDFMPRLQHRLYHVDDERMVWRRNGSGASTAFVVTVVLLISVAAWLPLARRGPPTVELPPIAAHPPRQQIAVPRLFHAGPLLIEDFISERDRRTETVFFRYSSLGSYASYSPTASGTR